MKNTKKPEEVVSGEVEGVLALERSLEDIEAELSKNEEFRSFLDKQKQARAQIATTWKNIQEQMIEHNVKSIKGDWGSITIAERTNYQVDMEVLPSKFIEKVANKTKIGTYHKLENKLPKGVTTTTTKYLTKRIK